MARRDFLPLGKAHSSRSKNVTKGEEESDDSGWKRQPELDYPTPASAALPVNEFEVDTLDEADDIAPTNTRMARIVLGGARQVALGSGDGMQLWRL